MIRVKFTYALKRFFPKISSIDIEAKSLEELIEQLEEHFPGIRGYVLEDYGGIRKHVNIFINGQIVQDKIALSDPIKGGDEVYIMQALSGG